MQSLGSQISSTAAQFTPLKSESQTHRLALRYLQITIFILMAFPRLRITVGPMPLYLIDVFIFMTWLYAQKLRSFRQPRLANRLVVIILGAAFLSEITSGVRDGYMLEHIYLFLRTALAISLFFTVPKIIRSKRDVESLLKAAIPGIVLSALLLIATSLPQSRVFVVKYVFSNPFLEPSTRIQSWIMRFPSEKGIRGRSLIGVSILTGAFLNTTWPLLLYLYRRGNIGQSWRILIRLTLFLVPVGVVMTYSRGAILGLFWVFLVSLFFAKVVRGPVVVGIGLALLFFSFVGWGSNLFYFERLIYATEKINVDPWARRSIEERTLAYVEPFRHVLTHPLYWIAGEGLARWREKRFYRYPKWNPADHAVFSAAYFTYGMIAAFAYVFLLLWAIRVAWRFARRERRSFATHFAQALFTGMMGFLSWFLFGHAAVSQPRGAMLMSLVFGLGVSLYHIKPLSRDPRLSIPNYWGN